MTIRTLLGPVSMCTAIALSSATFGSVAVAQTEAAVTKTVKYTDLDLSTKDGQDALETRLKYAVRYVCDTGNTRGLKDLALMQQCKLTAMSNAKNDMQLAVASYNRNKIASK